MFNTCYYYVGQHHPLPAVSRALPLMLAGGAFFSFAQHRLQSVSPTQDIENSPYKPSKFSLSPPLKTPSKLERFFAYHRLPNGPFVGPPFG